MPIYIYAYKTRKTHLFYMFSQIIISPAFFRRFPCAHVTSHQTVQSFGKTSSFHYINSKTSILLLDFDAFMVVHDMRVLTVKNH